MGSPVSLDNFSSAVCNDFEIGTSEGIGFSTGLDRRCIGVNRNRFAMRFEDEQQQDERRNENQRANCDSDHQVRHNVCGCCGVNNRECGPDEIGILCDTPTEYDEGNLCCSRYPGALIVPCPKSLERDERRDSATYFNQPNIGCARQAIADSLRGISCDDIGCKGNHQ